MITEEKLNAIYEGITNNKELTTKELNSYGFNSYDITKLIELGTIKRVKRGYYELLDIEKLYDYGKKLIKQKDYNSGRKCFEKVIELEPNHFGSNFRLFLKCIYEDDYQNIYSYFDKIINTTNKFYHIDYNTYLYLLNYLTEMPEKYKRYTDSLKIENLLIDETDVRYKNINKNNEIRTAIGQRKFAYALQLLKELIKEKGFKTQQDIIIQSLLYDVIVLEEKDKSQILNYIKEKDYESVKELLNQKESRVGLNYTEKLINNLINDIKSIKISSRIPWNYSNETKVLHEAIEDHNYELALKLSKEHNEKYNISNDNDCLCILLEEICKLIDEINKTRKKPITKTKDEVTEEQEEIIVKTEEKVTLYDVLNNLMNSDIEKTLEFLDIYMNDINKSEYIFLITRLIKLSILKNDFAFIVPITTLIYIIRNQYTFDISNFIQEFYLALTENKLDEAEIYLDIIRIANEMNLSNTNIENLEKVLNMNKGTNVEMKTTIDNGIEKSTSESENYISDNYIIESEEDIKKETFDKTTIENERKNLDDKYKEILNDKGIILLKPMNSIRRKLIHKLVETYPNMNSFSIGDGNNRRIVLKYKKENFEYIDVHEIIEYGNMAYNNKNYNLCIDYYKKLLELKKPKAFFYSKIGLAYMMKRQKSKAIDYLTVALELNKQENKNFALEDLLANLQGLIAEEDKKPNFKMTEEDFTSDNDDYCGIENIEEITNYITNSGLGVDTACKQLGITEEDISIIKLLIAKEYFSQGNIEKGNEFLIDVEKDKNKSQEISELLEKIRKNKKFYKHMEKSKTLNLTLTLKP